MSDLKHIELAPGISAGVTIVEREGVAYAEIEVRATRKRVQASAVHKAMAMVDRAWARFLLSTAGRK